MIRKKNRANYNSNPNYLDYLTALRKFFTNDADIIPIIMAFNFYINGVYATPYVDLFRQYDENLEDIHGPEKTKQLIDDGTIGVINEQIYEQGNGSLITSLETLRIYLEDRQRLYTIAYNPFVNAYAEYKIPAKNDLGSSNPAISINGVDPNAAPILIGDYGKGGLTQEQVNENVRIQKLNEANLNNPQKTADTRTTGNVIKPKQIGNATKGSETKTIIVKQNPLKKLFSKLSFLSHPKNKKINSSIPINDFDYYTKNKKNYDGNNY